MLNAASVGCALDNAYLYEVFKPLCSPSPLAFLAGPACCTTAARQTR
jgi:hypothetical protein